MIGLIVAVAFGFLAIFYGVRWVERAITFHPDRVPADRRYSPPEGAHEVWFNSADGTRLHGWFFPGELKPETVTVIYFHGNGGNISNLDWVGQRFAQRGFNVLLFDYRGYGASEGELGGESDLYADGDAAVAFVLNEKKVPTKRIVLYGQSLGTAVVADLASRQDFAALIIESGLSSASSVARTALPWLPTWLHFLGKNRFESARKLGSIRTPVLITHGDPDPVIPTDEARTLFANANEPKKLLIFPGADHNVFGSMGEQYFAQLDQFIRESLSTQAPRAISKGQL